jgi:hypothetical protein
MKKTTRAIVYLFPMDKPRALFIPPTRALEISILSANVVLEEKQDEKIRLTFVRSIREIEYKAPKIGSRRQSILRISFRSQIWSNCVSTPLLPTDFSSCSTLALICSLSMFIRLKGSSASRNQKNQITVSPASTV